MVSEKLGRPGSKRSILALRSDNGVDAVEACVSGLTHDL